MKSNAEVANFLKPCPCCGNSMPKYNMERSRVEHDGFDFERISVRITCECGLQTVPYLVERRPEIGRGDPGGISQLPVSTAMNLAKIWNSRV